MILYPKKKEKGFTIIEVLVSLTLFSIAVAGIITVSAQGGVTITAVHNRMTANYLAQEGIELLRAKRDSRILSAPGDFSIGWGDFMTQDVPACSGLASSPNHCDIDALNPDTITSCLAGSCPLGYISSGSLAGYYAHTATPEVFSRYMTIDVIAPDELKITSVVSWKEGQMIQTSTATENIFNWYGKKP